MSAKDFKNRIIGHGEESPDQILANVRNWRTHPKEQKDALRGLLKEVGFVQSVIINRRTGYLVDGHARVELALAQGQKSIPVVYVDLSDEEEALVLATLDPIGALAGRDDEQLQALLNEVEAEDAGLRTLLDALAGVGDIVDEAGLPDLASGDREPFQQMTFTLHDEQADQVKLALEIAKKLGPFDSLNENGNGNALARICETFITQNGG